jgi:hypothetical protein
VQQRHQRRRGRQKRRGAEQPRRAVGAAMRRSVMRDPRIDKGRRALGRRVRGPERRDEAKVPRQQQLVGRRASRPKRPGLFFYYFILYI